MSRSPSAPRRQPGSSVSLHEQHRTDDQRDRGVQDHQQQAYGSREWLDDASGPLVDGSMIELVRMLVGMYRTSGSEMPCITSGSTNTTATNAAIAAAVLRKISPKPKDIKANRAINKPVIITARSAPGDPRFAEGAPPPESIASPKKKATKLSSSQKTTMVVAVTPSLASSRTGRFGVAASVVRMVPLEYSPVMSNAPRTPPVRPATIRPVSADWVASKPW